MCGIIGYVGPREAKPLLLQGLERLEYRGYDSAGIALHEEHGLDYVRAVGPLGNLKEAAGPNGSTSTHGLGHTRWATHGGVTERNAHPLAGCDTRKISIVLNGIVENYRELRESLQASGHTYRSETDAETVTHLIEEQYDGDLTEAVRKTFALLEGHFTFVVIHHDHPDLLVGARHQTPMVVGIGKGEMFLASNAAAFLKETRLVQFPDDGDIVTVTPEGATFQRFDGTPVEREVLELDWDDEGAEKGGYETFMLKEIYEQPESVAETIGDRVRHGTLVLEGLGRERGGAEGPPPDRDPRRRHRLPRGRRRPVRDRGVGAGAGRAGHRLRVDLPQPGARPEHARDRHLAVGRDPRHDPGDAARPGDGRPHRRDHEHGRLADHARGRLGAAHALRDRDRRRRLEDVHRAGGAALPDRAEAGAVPRARCRPTRSR